ncbi:lipopolysaccharide transport periplasmic protein LptA [Streptomyces sp. DK15]|uniref:lipopolysaccharide transport periplasmic protein LptA n=1 Tax=Streptomyces sp. DK15 TaxID=2957499 RepID=UPI0029B0BE42|nr:lipopolysaccharide transport periplasmic protein LptA [Streptomyces sp. DK15]MDX2393584.1 lipopolysaccharide transport periplasmic protein LptA [Streptomyces sp. DK15]
MSIADQQALRVESDEQHLEDKGVSTYTGDVVVTQGNLVVKGNTVTITRTADGSADVITSVGNLAYLEYRVRAGSPEKIKCWGSTVQYQAQKNLCIVTDDAEAKVVDTDGKTHEGQKIVVNLLSLIATTGDVSGPDGPQPHIHSK